MASDETIGRATVQLGADGSKLGPEMAAALAKAQGELERANRKMERAQAATVKAIQGHIDKINAARPTHEMRLLEQAVLKLGGTSKLSGDQLRRVTVEVNALAAAGAKVPASLAAVTSSTSKLGAAFTSLTTGGGISGALAAIGPAGLAAAGAFGAVTIAGTKAFSAIKDLASQAEKWSNTAESTGLGTVQVQQLSSLLEDAGIPAEALGTAFKILQKEIATGGKELAKFGIDVAALKDLSPEEQFRAMASQIAAIEDPATRTAVALAAFGRSGQELIPVLDDVAKGSDRMLEALSEAQVKALAEADAKIDAAARKWEFLKKTFLATAIEFASYTPTQGVASIFGGGGKGGTKASTGGGRDSSGDLAFWSEVEREQAVERMATEKVAQEAREQARKSEEKLAAARRKAAEETARFADRVKAGKSDRMIEEMAGLVTMKDLLKAAPGAKKAGTAAGMVDAFTGSRLPGETASGKLEAEAKAAEEADKKTQALIGTFGTLSSQLTNLSQTVGGMAGKILGFAATLSSGLGGVLSGFDAFKKSGGGLGGLISKVSSGLGIFGSAVSVVGGLVGGIKRLFGGKSKEEKAAEAAAKKQKEEEAKQAKIQAAQEKQQGLIAAKGFAESLQETLAKGGLSAGLTSALQAIVGKISGALERAGLGSLDTRLKESEKFQEGSTLAQTIASALQASQQAGIFDTGLAAAGGQAAQELFLQQQAAAAEAGLSAEEATRAGFSAIAPILREQLNASIRSGQALDENTARLLEEAKANGIEILADPAIESLGVQKEQRDILATIADRLGAAARGRGGEDVQASRGFGPMLVPDLGGGRGPRIQTHAGELVQVIPRSRIGRGGIVHAARGLYDDGEPRERRRPGDSGGGADTATAMADAGPVTAQQLEAALTAIADKIQTAAPITVNNQNNVQIVDESPVKTVEGQRAFGKHVVNELNRALDQNDRGLEMRIERIATRAARQA